VDRVLENIERMPDANELRAGFDAESMYEEFLQEHQTRQQQCGGVVWCPADWKLIPKALWYHEFGYEAALMTLALHPDKYRKLLHYSAERGRQRAIVRARMVAEGVHPRAILTGEDLCSQQGPLVSPDYLRQEYWELVEYALEPLLEIGVQIVWHCDGNYKPLLDDVLASGIGGLQGFQRECGMELEWIRNLRTRDGNPLLIFGAMSVTETLPHGTPQEVRDEVRNIMDLCRDRTGLVFMTSNTITPDAPLENVLAYWRAVLESAW
jgi:uroporphyrinogen decarboxylase